MKKLFLGSIAAIGTTLSLSAIAVLPAGAATFTFTGNFSNGYSATGTFTTKSNAPASFSETTPSTPPAPTPFPTQFLQSESLSVFRPANTLIDSSTTVANGISNDGFLRLTYNSQNNTITELDVSTQAPGKPTYYFISNNTTPSNQNVPFGNTTYNLFSFDTTNSTATFLGAANNIQTTAVPEPSSTAGILAFGAFGAGYVLKRKFKKQKLARLSNHVKSFS